MKTFFLSYAIISAAACAGVWAGAGVNLLISERRKSGGYLLVGGFLGIAAGVAVVVTHHL